MSARGDRYLLACTPRLDTWCDHCYVTRKGRHRVAGRTQAVRRGLFRNLDWDHVNRQLAQAEAARQGAQSVGAEEQQPVAGSCPAREPVEAARPYFRLAWSREPGEDRLSRSPPAHVRVRGTHIHSMRSTIRHPRNACFGLVSRVAPPESN
jgi:hypothetical protein